MAYRLAGMLTSTSLSKRARTLVLACALSLTAATLSPALAYAEAAQDASSAEAEAPVAESPFARIGSFADEIKECVGAVAQKATERAAEQERGQRRQAVVDVAMDLRGVPYVYGGTTPSGFDCSGFTRWVFDHALGINLPRTAAEQSALGESVPMDALVPGDLLFFGSGSGVYHVAIYAGDGEYLHASTGQGQIVRQTMEYFVPDFAKRLV